MIARSTIAGADSHEVRIFYSYSRNDDAFRDSVNEAMSDFEWDILVRPWYDGVIPPGSEWEDEINRNLFSADIILLFISNHFMTSDYCLRVETPIAIQRHRDGEARVIPIILEETIPDWKTTELAMLQALPRNGRPISQWEDPQDALTNIAQEIINLVATQGLNPASRHKWGICLESDSLTTSISGTGEFTQALRNCSNDPTLRIVGKRRNQLLIESTRDGFWAIRNAFQDSKSLAVGGHLIIRLTDFFGAEMRAIADVVEPNDSTDLKAMAPTYSTSEKKFTPEKYDPVLMKGISFSIDDPTHFDFTIHPGDTGLEGVEFAKESEKVMDYFFTALRVPFDDLWVNLAPDDSKKILGKSLIGTRLGHDLLEHDLQIKRVTTSLLHPDSEPGSVFWCAVFEKLHEKLGTSLLPVNLFQRVWVVPERAKIYDGPLNDDYLNDKQRSAVITKFTRKVRLKNSFLPNYAQGDLSLAQRTAEIASPLFEALILPFIQQEIEYGESFALSRQISSSIILATWFRENYEETEYGQAVLKHAKLGCTFSMPGVCDGIVDVHNNIEPESLNEMYFTAYLETLSDGIFAVNRKEYDNFTNTTIVRTYLSGGIDFHKKPQQIAQRH